MYQTELAWNGGPVTNRTDLAEDAMRLVAECREEILGALRETKTLLAHSRITGRRI